MKRILITTALLAGFTASVLAQGTIAYLNNGAGIKAPVYLPETPDNTASKVGNTTAGLPAGTQVYTGGLVAVGYTAQFFAANGAVADANSLIGATTVNTFRSGSAAGILVAGTATFNGVADGAALATAQLRAWDNRTGQYPTWAQAEIAWRAGTIAAGVSPLVQVSNLGGATLTAPFAVGLQSFNIYFIPEPTVMALAGIGAAALLIFRRRN